MENTVVVNAAVGYRTEGSGNSDEPSLPEDHIDDPFDLSDNDYIFYRENFIDQAHINFLSPDSPIGPFAVSVVHNKDTAEYTALVRTREGNSRMSVPVSQVKIPFFRKLFGSGPPASVLLRSIDAKIPYRRVRTVKDPRLPGILLNLEEKQTIKGFKFGILYAKEGQTKEDEMFANIDSSPQFEEFLDFIGERVELDNWPRFRGGLDVKSGTTGKHGLFTEWNHNEIMFHVSTLLPFNPKDKQQLERKRHIGNDIVVIVFQDGETVFRPTTISSRQVHVIFVVKSFQKDDETFYRLSVISKDGVPPFGPPLPEPSFFRKGQEFKEFFYRKLLNAERACYKAPMLDNKLTRTRTALLKDIAECFM